MFEDKGDASDAEASAQEEDVLIQDEIYKSRLASIKRVSLSVQVIALSDILKEHNSYVEVSLHILHDWVMFLFRRRKVFSVKEIAMN